MKNNLTKQDKDKSGIYVITNLVNQKKYVGKTKCFGSRIYGHSSTFNTLSKKSINQYLIDSVKKHGKDLFFFTILEECSIEDCLEKELYWIKKLNTIDKNIGYNLRMDSSTKMIVHESTKVKNSIHSKRFWANGDHKDHSKKLKKHWETRNRSKQSDVMANNFTKYHYFIECDKFTDFVTPKQLRELGYNNVTHTFYMHKTDRVFFKGAFIRRIKIEDIVSSNVKTLE